ncbi:MAG TPA: hypothetical protein VEZ70_05065 [Allosphingosinicella sp.]|nr:hypothetical protein [Allosphingosinicella sp.]
MRWGAGALLLLMGAAPPPPPLPEAEPELYAQLIVREQIMVRVQGRQAPAPLPGRWKEGKGPKCVAAQSILGASLSAQESVDLILKDKSRVRAKLDSSCPALDYYHGFYIRPHADGMICADRDQIRSRVGGQCGIDRFRSLQAVARD